MQSKVEYITPEMAEFILQRNAQQNRRLRTNNVAKIRDDILGGRWVLTHQAIAIDTDGVLVDGQHRLRAIVAAGVGVPVVVARGVSPQAFSAMDIGRPRSVEDISGGVITKATAAIARVAMSAPRDPGGKGASSKTAVVEFFAKNQRNIELACEMANFKKPLHMTSGAQAAVFRALHYIEVDVLRRFCELVRHGERRDESERTAITYREMLISARGLGAGQGSKQQVVDYLKCANAIHMFANGIVATKIYAREIDHFPLPSGDGAVVEAAA